MTLTFYPLYTKVMPTAMNAREVVRALRRHGCTSRAGRGSHEIWYCPCGAHQVSLPTGHRGISPGLVGKLIRTFECLAKGWLQ